MFGLKTSRRSRSRSRSARTSIVPLRLPFRGWNTRDFLPDLSAEFSPEVYNIYMENGRGRLRGGSKQHATSVGSDVKSLMTFDDGSTPKMFAVSSGNVYDVTALGAGTQVVTGLTNSRVAWVNFATLGSPFLVYVNGVDGVRTFDGTTWATQTITGDDDGTSFNGVISHKSRLWFFDQGTADLYYLNSPLAISGGCTRFPVGALLPRGGSIAALATWTRDGGAGIDDYLVIISANGDVLVYVGTDPASDFALVGRYRIAAPVGGVRCVEQRGNSVAILTRDGVRSLEEIMAGEPAGMALTEAINPTFRDATSTNTTNDAWQIIRHTAKARTIVNAVITSTVRHQYVFSEQTASWTRLEGQSAECWVEFQGDLYFGTSGGIVFQSEGQFSDNGDAVQGRLTFSPTDFEIRQQKYYKRARVYFLTDGTPNGRAEMILDYKQSGAVSPLPSDEYTTQVGGEWDTFEWDTTFWADSPEEGKTVIRQLSGHGQYGALAIDIATTDANVSIVAAEVTIELGREL